MSFRLTILDRYILRQVLGTLIAVLALVVSLMTLEHLPRLLEITRLTGHRGYIVGQTIIGLLPEYAGIGLLVGLFLAIALTARRLVLRGELDAIHACGISQLRWMRYPLALSVLISILVFLNQAWLMPMGERQLDQIGLRMKMGEFGHQLPAGQFISLGSGDVLRFATIDSVTGELTGLFLKTNEQTYSARRGRMWMHPRGGTEIELEDGQSIRNSDGHVMAFVRFRYHDDQEDTERAGSERSSDAKLLDSKTLWRDGAVTSRATVLGRALWAVLVLLSPVLALVLGKPPKRQSGGAGIVLGIVLLVLGLKMISPLVHGNVSHPEAFAMGCIVAWAACTLGLVWLERVYGQGFFDRRIMQAAERYRPAWLSSDRLHGGTTTSSARAHR